MILDSIVPHDFKREAVPVDEYQKGGEILIAEWNAEQSMVFHEMMFELNKNEADKKNFALFMACMIACSMIKEDGSPLVDAKHFRELPKVFPQKVFERLYDKAAAMNGFTPKVIEKAKKN